MEIAVSDFSRSPLGCAELFAFEHIPSIPVNLQVLIFFALLFFPFALPSLVLLLLLLSCTL